MAAVVKLALTPKFSFTQFRAGIGASGLPMAARLLLHVLTTFANSANGECWPSTRKLAQLMGCSRRTVFEALRAAGASPLVKVERRTRPNGSSSSNLYKLRVPGPDGGCRILTPPCADAAPPELVHKELFSMEWNSMEDTTVCSSDEGSERSGLLTQSEEQAKRSAPHPPQPPTSPPKVVPSPSPEQNLPPYTTKRTLEVARAEVSPSGSRPSRKGEGIVEATKVRNLDITESGESRGGDTMPNDMPRAPHVARQAIRAAKPRPRFLRGAKRVSERLRAPQDEVRETLRGLGYRLSCLSQVAPAVWGYVPAVVLRNAAEAAELACQDRPHLRPSKFGLLIQDWLAGKREDSMERIRKRKAKGGYRPEEDTWVPSYWRKPAAQEAPPQNLLALIMEGHHA